MYYGDYGNYDKSLSRPNFDLYKNLDTPKAPPKQEQNVISFKSDGLDKVEYTKVDTPRATAPYVPLSEMDEALIGKYITQEQATRISEGFMSYFA